MFSAYGMSMERMKNLQAERVLDIIPAICGSKDRRLSHLGFQAIAHRDDDEFLGVFVSAMGEDRPGAWQYLTRTGDERTQQRRMKALAELGKGDGSFWRALTATKGFGQPFVEAAVAELKALPDRKLGEARRKWLAESLNDYLTAAASDLQNPAAPAMTAKEYEEFFAKNPPKKQD